MRRAIFSPQEFLNRYGTLSRDPVLEGYLAQYNNGSVIPSVTEPQHIEEVCATGLMVLEKSFCRLSQELMQGLS